MRGHASEGCGVDCAHSKSAWDVITTQGSPAPGAVQSLFEQDYLLPQPSATMRPTEAANRHHHPPQKHTANGGPLRESHLSPGAQKSGNHPE